MESYIIFAEVGIKVCARFVVENNVFDGMSKSSEKFDGSGIGFDIRNSRSVSQ